MLNRLAYWLAIGFGAGRAPFAPGTFGTAAAIPLYWLMQPLSAPWYAATTVLLFVLGVAICTRVVTVLGLVDPPSVVWDEIVGYLVTLFMAPGGWEYMALGFVLFRLFDVWKPYPIYLLERLPRGWGVMADDALAGVYAALCLQGLAWLLN